MRLGIHVRISEGLIPSTRKAAEIGCETIQVFAANPSAWRASPIKPDIAAEFRRLTAELDLHPIAVHTPYLLNLASPDPDIYTKSVAVLSDHMHRAQALGAEYVVTHIGSHKGTGVEQGIARICQAVSRALETSTEGTVLLLENSAGAGDSVGSRFEDLRTILDCFPEHGDRIGVCLDTAHLWSAGYDVSNAQAVAQTFEEFDAAVGPGRLKLLHLNDTKVELGAHVDRHANIGTGSIGEEGFIAILHHPPLGHLAGVAETPPRDGDTRDVEALRSLRDSGCVNSVEASSHESHSS